MPLPNIQPKSNKLKNSINHYIANASWMILEQVLRITAGLFVGIYIARYLGPEKFGLLSYVVSFVSLFGGVAKLGLDGIVVRELIIKPQLSIFYLGTAFWLKIIAVFITLLILGILVPLISSDSTANLYIFIISAGLLFQCFDVVEFYFQSQVLAKIVSTCKIVQLALSSIIKIYLVLTGSDLVWFVVVNVFDAFSLGISYLIAYQIGDNRNFYDKFNFGIARSFLKDSWPLIFSTIASIIYMRIDQIMIKEMLGEYEVGIYSAAVRLCEVFYFIPIVISTSFFPAILNAKKLSHKNYNTQLQRLYTSMVWIAISIAIPITFQSEFIISLLYGQAYYGAANVLVILAWSGVFVFLTISSGKCLMAENKTQKIFIRNLIGMIFNVILNLVLIPKFGIIGSAYATLASWFICGYLYDFIDKDQRVMAIQKTRAFIGAIN